MKKPVTESYRSEILLVALLMAMLMVMVLSLADVFAGSATPTDGPWVDYVRGVDDALAAKNTSGAEWAWQHAWVAALGSRRWDGLLAVGDTALRIGAAGGARDVARARARQAYLGALFRARQAGSMEGIVRASEAFLVLGDREIARKGLLLAHELAARASEPLGWARVRELADKIEQRPGEHSLVSDRVEVLP